MTPSAPPPSRFVLPILTGAVLRLVGLTRDSLWIDEILTLRAASIGEPFRWADVLVNPQGPLPHVLLRAWTALFGSGDLALRSWSALAGILLVVVAARVFRRVLPDAALAATWLVALSPFLLWYAHEVRNYVFLLLAALWVLDTFVTAVRTPGARRWVWHGVSLGVLLLCNLSGAMLLPALGLFLVWTAPRRVPGWVGALAVAFVIAGYWIRLEFGGHVSLGGIGSDEPLPRAVLNFHPAAIPFTYTTFLGGYGLGPALRTLHETTALEAFRPHVIELALAAVATCVCGALALGRLREPTVRLLLLWSVIPVLAAAGVALLGFKAFNPRYAAVAQPGFLLLLAAGWVAMYRRRPRWAAVLAAGLLVPMVVGGVRQSVHPDYVKEGFRETAAYLEANVTEHDLVLEQGVSGPLGRYYAGPAPLRTFYAQFLSRETAGEALLDPMLSGRERVFWVGSRLWFEDPEYRLRQWIVERGDLEARWSAPGVSVAVVRLRGGR